VSETPPLPPSPARTDYCGDLRADDVGRTVAVCGWVHRRREHGEHLAFIDLRDRTGLVQCVVDGAADLRSEYVVRVTGTVERRPAETENPSLATGAIEIKDATVEILAASEAPPFPLDSTDVDENLRLKHRYVDLRSDRMQRNLTIRARVNSALRAAMESQGFTEIETPMLIASTPEGARDFVVPSRLHPGRFYALPQSPQLFKQLTMVGGIDRYYQIARCLRDEDLRADRQFEFMQLDVEASFVGQSEVFEFISRAVLDAAEAVTGQRPGEIPSMTWSDAMERFGSDKPDVRFGLELVELTDVFARTDFNAFKAECIKGIRVPGGADFSRSRLDDLTDQAKRWGAKGLVWVKIEDDGGLTSPVAKFFADDEKAGLVATLDGAPGDLLLVVADDRPRVRHVLGLLRLELGRPPVNAGGLHFLWITEFPLFESLDEAGDPIPAHHPFTMPHPDDLALLRDEAARGTASMLDVRSQSYDLVLNGWEMGSGSVRIHDPEIQSLVFEILGIGAEEAQAKFGFLLDGFRYGAPPHAGFGCGIDRLVAILAGEENIREIIAFPKTQSGADPLTNAPTEVDPGHLDELGLRLLPRQV
jgi:aspartyl-tRNA synthetase